METRANSPNSGIRRAQSTRTLRKSPTAVRAGASDRGSATNRLRGPMEFRGGDRRLLVQPSILRACLFITSRANQKSQRANRPDPGAPARDQHSIGSLLAIAAVCELDCSGIHIKEGQKVEDDGCIYQHLVGPIHGLV